MAWSGNFLITKNQIAKAKGYDDSVQMDIAEHPEDWKTHRTLGAVLSGAWNGVVNSKPVQQLTHGLENWWYKNTGQSHLTDEYKHEEELSNTAIQREAADRQAAGLSKYGGVGGASSPSPSGGSGLLATALAAQQLMAGALALDEQRYNLKKAKSWGVPTTATDQFAQYSALSKLLFGKDVPDLVGDGGLVQKIGDMFSGFGSNFFGAGLTDLFSGSAKTAGGLTDPLYPEKLFGQEYPALFANPEFLSAIYQEDGKWKVPTHYWNLMKDDAEVAGMSIEDYASLLGKFLSSSNGKKLYNDARSNYYSSGTGNGAAGGGGHAW